MAMKTIGTLLLLAFLGEGIGAAQTKHPDVNERMMENSSVVENHVFSLSYGNPSMKYLRYSNTLTELYLGGEYQKEDLPSLIQEGDGIRLGNVKVSSFIKNKKSSLWGQAYYQNGKKTGRGWNETSDYKLLYPYVMGDTIGGSLKSEQYYFSGGCAYQISDYVLGLEGSYNATIEYRNADPRPKNLTGDLNIRIGLSRHLGTAYWLGAGMYVRKYKQTNDLAFYDELGVPNIFHFTGLGSDYYRFRGAKGESFYKGHTFGGSLDLLPSGSKGFSAAAHYCRFKFDKVISSLNELPMASVKEDNIRGEIAWKSKESPVHHWGVRGEMNYTRRIGVENLFGAATGNIFPQIGSEEKYMNKIYASELAGVYEYHPKKGLRLSVLPRIDYTQIRTRYLYPRQKMEVSFVNTGIDFSVARVQNKWMFRSELGTDFKMTAKSELDIRQGRREGESYMQIPVVSNYQALKAWRDSFHVAVRTDYSYNRKYAVYVGVRYDCSKDQRSSVSHFVAGQLGFAF